MTKRSLFIYSGACLILTCLLIGVLIVPSVLAKTNDDHTHDHTIFVEHIVEDYKAYTITKCSCGETQKTEMENTVVAKVENAQETLDGVEDGQTVILDAGNYGNLYIRKNDASEEISNPTWAGGRAHTTYKRTIKNVTILGTEGTIVSSIIGESAMYPNVQHSLYAEHPYLSTYLDIENLTIKNITFEPEENKVAVSLANSGYKTSINGLTIEGCTVNGAGTIDRGNRLFMSETQKATVHSLNSEEILVEQRKNITIKNNILNNLHQGVKINFVENLNVSGNQFNGIKGRDIMMSGGKMQGNITISGNISNGSTERFIRMTNLEGTLNMSNNIVLNNAGADFDIVKITNILEGSTYNFVGNSWEGLNDEQAIANGVVCVAMA